jgi:hypothetical protein
MKMRKNKKIFFPFIIISKKKYTKILFPTKEYLKNAKIENVQEATFCFMFLIQKNRKIFLSLSLNIKK